MLLTLETAATAFSLSAGCILKTLPTPDAISPPPLFRRGQILQHPPSRLIYDFVPCKIKNTDACKGGKLVA